MNERIRELVKQAGGHFATHNLMSNPIQHRESIELWDKHIEKFAELIVEKCAGIIESQDVDPSFKLRMSWAVKQYFGVEQ